ncbi:HEAT repeat domain-containing protein [uncultured Bilophila sp.]|uniref:epoxyqueuosine reductase n=1 Tax=uncultured Bilophila sp. TaxID=529385 RepID=UPI00280C20D1|nr:HEAT repeat domain-containing protein [uncultured Bilophila sp.]
MSLTSLIKEYALSLGYARVGITSAETFRKHLEVLNGRRGAYGFHLADARNPLAGAAPKTLMPSAKSIVSLAFDYARTAFPDSLLRCIGRIYLARCYSPPSGTLNGSRHALMRAFLEKNGCMAGDGIFLPERWCAARSGIAFFGRNNFAYAKGIGSFIALSSFAVDKELDYDAPSGDPPCPPDCDRCIRACPTGALEPFRLNPRKCLAFNAWRTQDGLPHCSSRIPPEIRHLMGTRIHGCDLCQEACPRNGAKLRAAFPEDPFLELIARDFSLPRLLNMTDGFFETRVRPIMYNYIKDPRYFRRNAAVALGNLRDPRHIPDLAIALRDPDELIRSSAAWALGRIGGRGAQPFLEQAAARESSASALSEIREALAAC